MLLFGFFSFCFCKPCNFDKIALFFIKIFYMKFKKEDINTEWLPGPSSKTTKMSGKHREQGVFIRRKGTAILPITCLIFKVVRQ